MYIISRILSKSDSCFATGICELCGKNEICKNVKTSKPCSQCWSDWDLKPRPYVRWHDTQSMVQLGRQFSRTFTHTQPTPAPSPHSLAHAQSSAVISHHVYILFYILKCPLKIFSNCRRKLAQFVEIVGVAGCSIFGVQASCCLWSFGCELVQ